MSRRALPALAACLLLSSLAPAPADARNTIRRAFFNVYPSAEGTRLSTLPSASNHCGVCHYAFGGAGPRNPYGQAVGVARGQYSSDEAAIQSLDGLDSDGDGYSNHVEILDRSVHGNTPTFPGLTGTNVNLTSGVSIGDILGHLTPVSAADTTPPSVTLLSPNGGGSYGAETIRSVTWTASDPGGLVVRIDILMSDDGGASWKFQAKGLANTGSWAWFVPNRPGPGTRLRVVGFDLVGNQASDDSDAPFTITAPSRGYVPTTLRDFDMPGTQPFDSGVLEDPSTNCVNCHGNYDHAAEPWHVWRGSMMAHAARDPLFFAMMAVAEQEAPSSGDLCLRCHTPGGWQEGRSNDTSGGQLLMKDRQSVHCDFCHRVVDPQYVPGVSPAADQAVLAGIERIPPWSANGQFVTDSGSAKRGPYSDAVAEHPTLLSPYHRDSKLCGTCHDVSNPVFVKGPGAHRYDVQALDAAHPDGDRRNMFPVERTYSEWEQSAYASGGVYAPQFAGNRPDGMVATCQDCHMRDVSGRGAAAGPVRGDLPLHDLTGGNYFVPDILANMFPGEVDAAELAAGKQRVLAMLALAASVDVQESAIGGNPAITVRVTNETGHKLPSGYPEGRRVWLRVRAWDGSAQLVYESGHYNAATGHLSHDADLKIYETKPGISTRLGAAIGLPAGPSFHFVLNDTIYFDNRIPPRGFSNAAFTAVQAAPVGHPYADGQHWDETTYELPYTAVTVRVELLYQTTTAEFVTFLRDANTSNSAGLVLYDQWVNLGRCPPATMADVQLTLGRTAVGPGAPPAVTMLAQNSPNPFNPRTSLRYSLAAPQHVQLRIYDLRGRLVRTLAQDRKPAGVHEAVWDGTDERGQPVESGLYLARLRTQEGDHLRKMTLLR